MAGRDDYLHCYVENCIFMIRGQVLGNCHKKHTSTGEKTEFINTLDNIGTEIMSDVVEKMDLD